MVQFYNIKIEKVSIHYVGNKNIDEGYRCSKESIKLDSDLSGVLTNYFLKPFLKKDDFGEFYHETDLNLNEVFIYVSRIFSDINTFQEQSANLVKHLYEQSIHPQIKGGELYVVYFKDCIVNDTIVDAIGLFKSENKDIFLKIYPKGDNLEIESDRGININKLDKGCIIFNSDQEKGYLVAAIDNTNKGLEAKYWIDHFLQIRSRKDEYFYTQNFLSLCNKFMDNNPNIDKSQKAAILKKTVSYFKNNDTFDMDKFSTQILDEERIVTDFQSYKAHYEKEKDLVIVDDFAISDQALKKQSKTIKNTITLDNNFKITINGDINYLEKGFDKTKNLHYYKLLFKNEQ